MKAVKHIKLTDDPSLLVYVHSNIFCRQKLMMTVTIILWHMKREYTHKKKPT